MSERRSSNAAIFLVCVDKAGQSNLSGRLYNGYYSEPFLFGDVGGFLLLLDDIPDCLDFPQRLFAPRFFPHCEPDKRDFGEPGPRWDSGMLAGKSGLCATFRIQILFRQNASLQGRLTWPGSGTVLFRSALELLHIILAKLHTYPAYTSEKEPTF